MRYIIAIGLLLSMLGHASAEVSPDDDPGILIVDVCAGDTTSLDNAEAADLTNFCSRAARMALRINQLLPATYYKAKLSIDWCSVTARLKLEAKSEKAKRLSLLFGCGGPPPIPARGANRVAVVSSGVADFFFSYAVQEVIDFVVQDYLKTLCKAKPAITKLTTGELFKHSCSVLFSSGNETDPIYDATTLRQLRKSLVLDLQGVAPRAWAWVERRLKAKLDPRIVTGLAIIIKGAVEIAIEKKAPPDLLKEAAKYAIEVLPATPDPHVCVLDPVRGDWLDGQRARCLGLLAAKLVVKFDASSIAHSVDSAAKEFCSEFGKVPGDQEAKCLFDGQSYVALNERLVALARELSNVFETFEIAHDQPRDADSWSRVAAALVDLVTATKELVDITQLADFKQVTEAIDLASSLTRFALALSHRDSNAMRTYLLGALNNPLISSSLSAKGVKIVTFIFSLYEANDRNDVEQILKEVATPIGTYRRKYDLSERWSITVNGWLGAYGGYAVRFNDAVEADQLAGGLTLPIGLDFQPDSLSGKRGRLSFGLTFLDPLGAAQLDKSKDIPDARLISIINAGAHATLGLGKSPFVIRAGVDYKPGLNSETMCGSELCFRGSLLFTLGLAIDVPVLVLR